MNNEPKYLVAEDADLSEDAAEESLRDVFKRELSRAAENNRRRNKEYREIHSSLKKERELLAEQHTAKLAGLKFAHRKGCSRDVGSLCQEMAGRMAYKSGASLTFFILTRKFLCFLVLVAILAAAYHRYDPRSFDTLLESVKSRVNREADFLDRESPEINPEHIILQNLTESYSKEKKLKGWWQPKNIHEGCRTLAAAVKQVHGNLRVTQRFYKEKGLEMNKLQAGDVVMVYIGR